MPNGTRDEALPSLFIILWFGGYSFIWCVVASFAIVVYFIVVLFKPIFVRVSYIVSFSHILHYIVYLNRLTLVTCPKDCRHRLYCLCCNFRFLSFPLFVSLFRCVWFTTHIKNVPISSQIEQAMIFFSSIFGYICQVAGLNFIFSFFISFRLSWDNNSLANMYISYISFGIQCRHKQFLSTLSYVWDNFVYRTNIWCPKNSNHNKPVASVFKQIPFLSFTFSSFCYILSSIFSIFIQWVPALIQKILQIVSVLINLKAGLFERWDRRYSKM